MKLDGHVALVSGSNRGIGEGIALALARDGSDVAVNYRRHADEAEAVAEKVRGLGRRALVCQADVSRRDQVDAMVQQTVSELGKVSLCVCNAAKSTRRPFLELTNDDVQKTIGVALMGVFNLSQACARHMVERGEEGSILVISSVHASIPFAGSLAYNTCKAGINHMANTMAEELAPHRIRVNVIEPGWIDTPGEHESFGDQALEEAGSKLPWGRLGTIDEIGRAAAFLCSNDASYITGATLRVDGGFWLPSRAAHAS